MEKTEFISNGIKIEAVIRIPAGNKHTKHPAILLAHGYSGDMREYDSMAGYLCNKGFATMQFNFRGCSRFSEKGRMMCATEWVEDAAGAISFLANRDDIDNKRIGISGCSMGGAISLMMGSMDPRIRCVVAMAPVGDGKQALADSWRRNKNPDAYQLFLLEMTADMQRVSMGLASRMVSVPYALAFSQSDEVEYNEYRAAHPEMVSSVPLISVFNSFILMKPLNFCADIHIPVLLIHGDMDYIIDISQSEKIIKTITSPCALKVVKDGPHPLPTSRQAAEVFDLAAEWFNNYL